MRNVVRVAYERMEYLGLAAVLLYGLISVRTIFEDGIIPGWDNPAHLYHSYMTATYFLPNLNILGWDPFQMFGWVFNQYYNPGAYLLVSAVYYLLLGRVSIGFAYKLAFLIVYLLPGIGLFFYVKSLSRSKIAPVIASLLALTVFDEESPWMDAGLRQMFIIGMWPHRFGIGLALLAAALFNLLMECENRFKRILLALWLAGIVAYSALIHTMAFIGTVIILLVHYLSALLAETSRVWRSGARPLAGLLEKYLLLPISFLFALLLVSFWTIPLFETLQEYHSIPAITWKVGPTLFSHILDSLGAFGKVFLLVGLLTTIPAVGGRKRAVASSFIASLVLVTLVSLLALNDGYLGLRLLYLTAVSFAALVYTGDLPVFLPVSMGMLLLFLGTGPETYQFDLLGVKVDVGRLIPFKEELAYAKFGALARFLLFVPASIGFDRVIVRFYKITSSRESQVAILGVAFALLIAANYFVDVQARNTDLDYPFSRERVFKLDGDYPQVENLKKAMVWIRDNVEDNTYTLVQDTLVRLGDWNSLPVSHYLCLTSMVAEKPVVGGMFGTRYITLPIANTETDTLLGFPMRRLAEDEELLLRLSRELGISYYVVFDPVLKATLGRSPNFVEMTTFGPLAVYRTVRKNEVVTADAGIVTGLVVRPNHLRFKVLSDEGSLVRVRMVYYPGWTLRINGVRAQYERYYPQIPSVVRIGWLVVYNYRVPFIQFKVPPGEVEVEMVYSRVTLGNYVSTAALAALLAYTAAYVLVLRRRGAGVK